MRGVIQDAVVHVLSSMRLLIDFIKSPFLFPKLLAISRCVKKPWPNILSLFLTLQLFFIIIIIYSGLSARSEQEERENEDGGNFSLLLRARSCNLCLSRSNPLREIRISSVGIVPNDKVVQERGFLHFWRRRGARERGTNHHFTPPLRRTTSEKGGGSQ